MSDNSAFVSQLANRYRHLMRATARLRSESFAVTSLTMQQFKVLTLLYFEGTLSGNSISAELGVSMATVTGLVDRLVDKELVTRSEDPTDRRVRRIRLTATGEQEVNAMLIANSDAAAEFVSRMSSKERLIVDECLTIFIRIAQEMVSETDSIATSSTTEP